MEPAGNGRDLLRLYALRLFSLTIQNPRCTYLSRFPTLLDASNGL